MLTALVLLAALALLLSQHRVPSPALSHVVSVVVLPKAPASPTLPPPVLPLLAAVPASTPEVPQIAIQPDAAPAAPVAAPAAAAPPAAPAPRASPVRSGDIAAYLASISALMQRHLHYPPAARRGREEGTAQVHLIVDRNGKLLLVELAKSSGFADLDDEALEVVRRSEPLPAFPAALSLAQINAVMPVGFALNPR